MTRGNDPRHDPRHDHGPGAGAGGDGYARSPRRPGPDDDPTRVMGGQGTARPATGADDETSVMPRAGAGAHRPAAGADDETSVMPRAGADGDPDRTRVLDGDAPAAPPAHPGYSGPVTAETAVYPEPSAAPGAGGRGGDVPGAGRPGPADGAGGPAGPRYVWAGAGQGAPQGPP
ncbi:hypothetical protein [Corynebacterium bovis]|nr:hypothetical protein [Corynebacterium bovis]RRQ13722.1 hypothetical protein CXF47_04940 [Corynebacterium bovis]